MKISSRLWAGALAALGVAVLLENAVLAQGCTASRGCPTIPPSLPSSRSNSGMFNFNSFNSQQPASQASFGQSQPVSTRGATNSAGNGLKASQQDAPALIRVIVPKADAKVWFQGTPTERQGITRLYASPGLANGATYRYVVRCAWQDGGREVVREQSVVVQAGRESRVDFAAQPRS